MLFKHQNLLYAAQNVQKNYLAYKKLDCTSDEGIGIEWMLDTS